MKKSIKLKYSKELAEIIQEPVLLAILVQVAFNMNENTGKALISIPEKWRKNIRTLVVMGLLEHTNYEEFNLTNKKIIDITLKKKPNKAEVDNQSLINAKIIPKDLVKYHDIAKAFWELFYSNITRIGGRVYNLENAKFNKWVTPIRLMIESDGITTEQLREVFRFLQKSEFWRDKVQSTQKLRQKFETLYNQIKSNEQKNTKSGNSNSRKTKVSTEYVKRVFKDLQS